MFLSTKAPTGHTAIHLPQLSQEVLVSDSPNSGAIRVEKPR